jgi:predicted nucleic acid-binding Zn ribbon protein
MKDNCLVCASEFETKDGENRMTCSENCRKEYAEFRQKLEATKPEDRQALVTKFLAKIESVLGKD